MRVGSAHAAGIIHRILKPENILLSRTIRIKIVRFRIGQAGRHSEGLLATEEMPGPVRDRFLGTLLTPLPEQHRNLPVDQADRHFRSRRGPVKMLTGECPFKGKTCWNWCKRSTSVSRSRCASCDRPSLRLSRLLIARALRRDPADRYPNVAALVADLKLAAEGGELMTQADGSAATVSLILRRFTRNSAYLAAAQCRARENLESPSCRFRSLSTDQEDSYMAMGIGSEINSALSRVPGVRVASHLSTYRYRDNEVPDLAHIAAELKIRYVLTGSLRHEETESGNC